jgi:hypothetical protein
MSAHNPYAIITPYHGEERRLLQRCIDSVRAQTSPADHFMIADGLPQDWIDQEPVRHLKLDREHRDHGNTPCGIGAILAIAEGYEGIGLLDAHNWLERTHIASCMEAARGIESCDYVVAKRNLRGPDGSVIDLGEGHSFDEDLDRNCLFLLPGSHHVLPHLSLIPRELSALGDRIFHYALISRGLNTRTAEKKTVNCRCLWEPTDDVLGGTPPPKPRRTHPGLKKWFDARTARELRQIHDRCGSKIVIR